MSNELSVKKLDGQKLQLLEKKIEDAKQVIRDAFGKYGPEALRIAWTGGKDSTLVLWMAREVCMEMGIRMQLESKGTLECHLLVESLPQDHDSLDSVQRSTKGLKEVH